MTQHPERHSAPVPPQGDQEVVELIRKMQQQLVFLERKIDTLLGQSSDRPFRPKPFSKPYRSFGGPRRREDGGRDHGPRDDRFSQGHPFERPRRDGNREFGNRKKSFFHGNKDRG